MKKVFVMAVFAAMMQTAFAQYDQNNPPQPAQNQTQPAQTNPEMNQTNPDMQNQTKPVNDWDLYGGTLMEKKTVPQSTANEFDTKYPNQKDVQWYSYSKGYIATYPGQDKMQQGVLYDKNGKVIGTVSREKYSTLSTTVTANMKKKYPDYKSEYVYVVTTPTGKKMYVTKYNETWSEFNENGMYNENK